MWMMARIRINIASASRLRLNRAPSDPVVSLNLLGAESLSLNTEQFAAMSRIAFLVSVLMYSGLARFSRLMVELIIGWPKLVWILIISPSVYKAKRTSSGFQLYSKQ